MTVLPTPSQQPDGAMPVILPPNPLPCYYAGGALLGPFRGVELDDHRPEEWLASTTSRFSDGDASLSRLPDGRLLREAIEAEPVFWLGQQHVDAFGPDPQLLVKLLDAGQRLPVHVHPDRNFAASHLGCAHGKTEAWVIIATAQQHGTVYLGLREPSRRDELLELVDAQDGQALIGLLNPVQVRPGDSLVVPAGTLHAIGPGVLLVEVQEPTDFSLTLEREGFGMDVDAASLGLGTPLLLAAVNYDAMSSGEIAELRRRVELTGSQSPATAQNLLSGAANGYFRAELVRGVADPTVAAGFAVGVVIDGEGELEIATGEAMAIASGQAVLIPHAAGQLRLRGEVSMVLARPPVPPE